MTKSKLLCIALLLSLIPTATVPAQDAPPEAPAILTADEIALWQAWIRADLQACYSKAQTLLEQPGYEGDEFRIALALQARCASELGWDKAHASDLKALIDLHADKYEADVLRWELIERKKRLGELDDIPAMRDQLGFITDWWVAGPFPNDRGQGFEDVQEPERNLDLNAEYTGKDGQAVTWRNLPVKALDGTIDIAAVLRPNDEATAFLLTAVWADEQDSDAQLSLSSTDQTRVSRVYTGEAENGETLKRLNLLETDSERELGFDQDRTARDNGVDGERIHHEGLSAGWNVFLVKAGQADADWRLRIRLASHAKYRVAASLEEMSQAVAGLGGSPPKAGLSSSTAVGNRPPYLRGALELLCPTRDKTSTFARRELDELLNGSLAGPITNGQEKTVLKFLLAWASRSSASVAAGREENRRRELLKQCLELDPKAARAALELSQYYTTTFGNPALADDYAKLAVKAAPGWLEARMYAARVVQMKGLEAEVERELANLQDDYPDNANVLRFAAYYAGLRKDYATSNELFARALQADFTDTYARDRLIERAVQRGDLKEATRYAAQARKLDPFNTSAATQLAELHWSAGRFSLAERELQSALKIAPRDDRLLELLGRAYAGWADSDAKVADETRAKSLEAYRAALDANPNREDIERYLEFVEGEQPPFEAALQADITERIEAALEEPVNEDNPYEILYREKITVVNEDGTTATYTQDAYRITNDNGRDWLRSIRVPAWSGQQGRCMLAEVWREDGEREQGRRSTWSASFPPLEIGDIVHVRFRVTDREQSFFGDFYGTREVLGESVPIKELRLHWVLPRGKQFHEYLTLGAPQRTESEIQGRKVWSYVATDLPRLEDEPLALPEVQRAPTVQLSTYGDWREFGRWYYNLIKRQLEPTPEMTVKVNELTAGLATEEAKARAIYNWVVTEVRYNADWHFGVHGYKPFSAGAVFARCIGDCKDKAILICTMLGIAGVKAYPVIINLENFRGNEDITLPMPNHFNHAIACIEYSDGRRQFVDGTTTYHAFEELPSGDAGASVIVVRVDGGERATVPVPGAERDRTTDDIEAEFAAGGTLKLRVTRTGVGDSAASLRQRYQREGERKRQLEQEWSDHFAGAKVSDIGAENIAGLTGTPKLTYTVELPNAWAQKDNGIEFKLAVDPTRFGQTGYASLTTRKTPLVMPPPMSRVSVVKFNLPQGTKPADLPKAMEHKGANLALNVAAAYSADDGTLTVTRSYGLLGGVVAPEDYVAFRQKLIEFDSAEARTIRLVRE